METRDKLEIMYARVERGMADFHHAVLVSQGPTLAHDVEELQGSLEQYRGDRRTVSLGKYDLSTGIKPGVYTDKEANDVLGKIGRKDLIIRV